MKTIQIHQYTLNIYSTMALQTLFNIVEAPFKNCWTLMAVLYDDVPVGHETAGNIQKCWHLRGHYQDIYDWILPLNKRSGLPIILTQQSMGRNE